MSSRRFEDAEHRREHGLSNAIVEAAIEVHEVLGPGLLESACHELTPNMNADMRPGRASVFSIRFRSSFTLLASWQFCLHREDVKDGKSLLREGGVLSSRVLDGWKDKGAATSCFQGSGEVTGWLLNLEHRESRDGLHRLVLVLRCSFELTPSMRRSMSIDVVNRAPRFLRAHGVLAVLGFTAKTRRTRRIRSEGDCSD